MKAPRIARCPLRAFASPECAQGAEKSRRESRVAHSALARLADAREGLKKSAAIHALPAPRFRVSRTREGLKKAAANRAFPAPRWRVSRMRARG